MKHLWVKSKLIRSLLCVFGLAGSLATGAMAQANHEASVADPNRVFHRIYVTGAGESGELGHWKDDLDEVKAELEKPGNQADGSTSVSISQPTVAELKTAIATLKAGVNAGDEITFYYSGHGYGGKQYGLKEYNSRRDEDYDEAIWLTDSNNDDKADFDEQLMDDDFAALWAGLPNNVSVSVLMDACYAGGFTGGRDDLKETTLVRLIGPYTQCPTDSYLPPVTTISEDIVNAVQSAKSNGADIVTTQAVLNYLNENEWGIGAPFDSDDDLKLAEAAAVKNNALAAKPSFKSRGRQAYSSNAESGRELHWSDLAYRLLTLEDRLARLPDHHIGTPELKANFNDATSALYALVGQDRSAYELEEINADLDDIEESVERREEEGLTTANEEAEPPANFENPVWGSDTDAEDDASQPGNIFPGYRPSFSFGVGAAHRDGPQTGFGVNISQDERFIGRTPEVLEGVDVRGRAEFPFNSNEGVFIDVDYRDLDGNSTSVVPADGDVVGIVFDQEITDPVTGAVTGINLGPSGATVLSRADLKRTEVGFGILRRATEWRFVASASVITETADYDSDFVSGTLSDFVAAQITQEVDQTYYGVEVGVGRTWDIGDFALDATGTLAGYRREADLESVFDLTCAFCPPVGQAVESRITDSDEDFAFGVGLSLGAMYEVVPGVEFGLRFDSQYIDKSAQVVNPETGDLILAGETTALDTRDTVDSSLTAHIRMTY